MSRTLRQRRIRERRRTRRRAQLVLVLVTFFSIFSLGSAYATYDYLKGDDEEWPTIDKLQPQRIGENSMVLSADGKLMGYIQSDQNRKSLELDKMGEWAPKATVAIEDRRFFKHNGVDPEGMLRALSTNIESGSTKEGASTITQQVIRNLYKEITTEKTLTRKAKEATLAMQLEQRWSKERVLQTYLNLSFYGNNAYGIEAAARTYFSKPASKLTIAEAALLAGLPQAPSQYDPFKKTETVTNRRNQVLFSMRDLGMITEKEYTTARNSKIQLKAGNMFKIKRLPYFFDYVEKELISQFGVQTVRQGGLRVKTTIDPRMQKLAEQAITDTLGSGGPSGAIVVLDTPTGQIKAMASPESYKETKFNRAAQSVRQPGSTAKIWALAAFLREGINPDSTVYQSRPIKVRYKGSGESGWWQPKTYSGSYRGSMSVRSATIASDNSVYAQMTLDITPEKVAQTARLMGVQSRLTPVWSIGLGSIEVTPLEQTNFYATIARGGRRIDPRAVSQVITPAGSKLDLQYPKPRRVIEDWQAKSIVDILRDNVTGGTGTGANISGADVSGKTGTTDDSKDAWFCGMTAELTACVWIGYTNPQPMYGETGGNRPATIWRRFMDPALKLVKDRDWFETKGTPTWVPFTSTWQSNPSFDVSVGQTSQEKAEEEAEVDEAEDSGAAQDNAPEVEVVQPVTTPDPVAPPPDAGGANDAPPIEAPAA